MQRVYRLCVDIKANASLGKGLALGYGKRCLIVLACFHERLFPHALHLLELRFQVLDVTGCGEQHIVTSYEIKELVQEALDLLPQLFSQIFILCPQFGQVLCDIAVCQHLAHGIGYHFVKGFVIGDFLSTDILQAFLLMNHTLVHGHFGLLVGLNKKIRQHFVLCIRPLLNEVG